MIESAEDARKAVRACRYPPEGARSFGPTRASLVAGPDYFATANHNLPSQAYSIFRQHSCYGLLPTAGRKHVGVCWHS